MGIIAVYGGAFSPWHNGHQDIVRKLIENEKVVAVEIVPTYRHPHYKEMADYDIRIALISKAVASEPSLRDKPIIVSRREEAMCKNAWSSFVCTADLMQEVQRKPPFSYREGDHEVVFVTGADNLEEIEDWQKADELLDNFRVIGVTREGHYIDEYVQKTWFAFELPGLTYSSTYVRDLLFTRRYSELLGHVPSGIIGDLILLREHYNQFCY